MTSSNTPPAPLGPIASDPGKSDDAPDRAVAIASPPTRSRIAAVWQRMRPRPSPLVAAFARDRLLLVATAVLALSVLAPLFVSPFLPLADLPDNLAAAALLSDVARGGNVAAYHYEINKAPLPYWTAQILMAVGSAVIGPLLTAKVIVGFLLLALPLVTMRLLIALDRDPRLGLLAFALSWEHSMFSGWITYLVGMNAALLAAAWLIDSRTKRDALIITALALFIALSHIQAVAYFGVFCVGYLLASPSWQQARGRFVRGLIAGSGLLLVAVPWIMERIERAGGGGAAAWEFDMHPLGDRVRDLFRFTLDNQVRPLDRFASALAFLALLVTPVALASLLPRRTSSRGRDALVLLAVPLLLYCTLWMTISGPIFHWYTYPRYATFTFIGLLLLPAVDLGGRRWLALAPALAVVMFFHARVTAQIADYGSRAAPFLAVIDHVRPNSRVLPLELDDQDPATRVDPFNQIHAYVAAVKKGYDPHLFDNPSIPLLFRHDRMPPMTAWNGASAFKLEEHGKHFDYVLVQGKDRDPVAGQLESESARAKLVVEAGRFRLYEITLKASEKK